MLKIKKVVPMFNNLLCTMDRYESDRKENGVIDVHKQQGDVKEFQRVVAAGPFVKGVKEGDLVLIDPSRYAVKKHREGSLKDGVIGDNPVVKYVFNTVEVDGEQLMLVTDQDIVFVVEEYEEV